MIGGGECVLTAGAEFSLCESWPCVAAGDEGAAGEAVVWALADDFEGGGVSFDGLDADAGALEGGGASP